MEENPKITDPIKNMTDKFKPMMNKLYTDGSKQFENSNNIYNEGIAKFTQLVGFFAEDTKKTTTDEFFGIMKNFISEYKAALKANQERKDKAAKEAKREQDKEDRRKREEAKKANKIQAAKKAEANDGEVMDSLMSSIKSGAAPAPRTDSKERRQRKTPTNKEDEVKMSGSNLKLNSEDKDGDKSIDTDMNNESTVTLEVSSLTELELSNNSPTLSPVASKFKSNTSASSGGFNSGSNNNSNEDMSGPGKRVRRERKIPEQNDTNSETNSESGNKTASSAILAASITNTNESSDSAKVPLSRRVHVSPEIGDKHLNPADETASAKETPADAPRVPRARMRKGFGSGTNMSNSEANSTESISSTGSTGSVTIPTTIGDVPRSPGRTWARKDENNDSSTTASATDAQNSEEGTAPRTRVRRERKEQKNDE